MKNNSIRKILVVAESIDVEDSSGTKGRVALIKNLHKAGYELVVCHYTRQKIQLGDIKCIALKENRKSILFFISRIERHLRFKFKINLNTYIEKAYGFSFAHLNDRNSIAAGLRKIKDYEPDLVLTLSKGASFRPHHALLSLTKWHSKWMAYIHDPYPMHSYPRPYDWVEPGHQQKRNFFLRVSTKAEYAAYPSKLLAEWMESYFQPLKGKSLIIPHQIDEDEIVDTNLPEYFKKDAFTIVHAGALMGARNPLGLVNAFRRFLKETPKAKTHSQLVFLGKRSRFSEEFKKIKKEQPQIYSSNAYVPFKTVLAIQKAATVNVILEAKGPISPFLPGKFPHCIQAGKPILLLGPFYSESKRLLGEDYTWWSEIDDEAKIFEHINSLYNNWSKADTIAPDYQKLMKYLSSTCLKEVISKI